MKKISTFLFAVLLSASMAFSQPVNDMGVIPIGVSLSSILRLNVVSGGNIEFVVNTMDQYQNGIAPSTAHETRFTVSSSVDFNVDMYAEDATLIGTDDNSNTMPLDNIGYKISAFAANVGVRWNIPSYGVLTLLDDDPASAPIDYLIQGIDKFAAGPLTQNDFTIQWELATLAVVGLGTSGTLLSQSLLSDRYVTNVYLLLSAGI